MSSRWTAVGGLLLIAFTSAAVSVQASAPPSNAGKSDQGVPQPADQNDPASSRPEDQNDPAPSRPEDQNDPAPSRLEDQNDPAPSRPEDQKYPGPPQPANEGAAAGRIATTTTLDPLEEYCKEACAAGIGGDMCDCPDHPIG